ncbi:MAG TPA: exo-beta-N-acetylmuramidase NamZ domain-containing protein [Pyrinomonadaceae bacterium]|nr:exo-beta-N-acetylmuramidase NamZ domain-containing protein [Pyrinomonadaceae bacterium]
MNIAQTVGLRRAALAKHLSNSMPSQPSNKQNRFMSRLSFRRLSACLLLVAFAAQIPGKNLPVALPSSVGMSAERLARIDAAVAESIARKETPGAVVLAARRGRVVWRKAYGARALVPKRETMTTDTIFDAASLTKVVATATSIMILVERGQVRLSDPLSRHLPQMREGGRENVTIEELLTHRAGFGPDFDLREQWTGYEEAMKRLAIERLRNVAPGRRFLYSDIGYIALGEVVKRVSGEPLDVFARRNIFEPLGMRDTTFNPPAALRPRIAPTEQRRAQAAYLGGRPETLGADADRWLRGEVHDPTAFRMNGVAGHAGLFTTADDLAVYCQMILNGGSYGGVRILSPFGVATMTRPRAVLDDGSARALGWDVVSSFSSNRGDLFPLGSFGHTGFTGTSLWLDPASQAFVVFLSNRVHPDGKGDVGELRGRVASIVASSLTDVTAEQSHGESARFASETLMSLAHLNAIHNAATPPPVLPLDADVLNGIDVLERDGFRQLAGLRVGLVTNHTGRDRRGRQTIDVLREAANVKLVALFAPEHGIRGLLDDKVADTKDEKTGLPVYSLYGETRRPKPEQLRELDAIVFDIQDVGVRFYTYIATLGHVMEEAARARLPVFVLDRPNPIRGNETEGPVADADKLSFTSYHTIPVRHGMTTGEIARFFNAERKIGCDLRVVEMERWRRGMWFDGTGQTWVSPSPNMRSLTQATLYPGVGLLETSNVSVGRGTDTPFELVGAPWIDGQRLANYLNERRLGGVRFVPVRFTPRASVFQGEECGGVNLIITDRAQLRPVYTGLEIAAALRRLHPDDWQIEKYLRLLANADTLERLKRGESPEQIALSWQPRLEEFRRARTRALIYR